jgi:hypothetical protein
MRVARDEARERELGHKFGHKLSENGTNFGQLG